MKEIDKPAQSLTRVVINLLCVFIVGLTLNGCGQVDPLLKHKILTTIFDGVPDMPSIEELCEDNMGNLFNKYYEKRITEASMGAWEEGNDGS